jgi:hypothetical protein
MKQPKITSKIIALLLTVIVVIGVYFPAKTTHAQVAVIDSGNITQSTITATQTTLDAGANILSKAYNYITSRATNGIWIKEYILDPLAWAVAKSLVQQIVNSTVKWINSGFSGSPSFVTNPTQFFENVGDQATGAFLAQNGPLSSLCSPISLNIRLALALDRAGVGQSPYTCTLSKIINNVQGATINGFTAGDFRQGGWPAFVTLAEPQNSFYGAYLEAQSSLSANIAKQTQQINNELMQGQGFLTFKECKDDPSITGDQANQADISGDSSIKYNDKTGSYQRCTNSTPGSVISASLNKALGAGQDSLVTADEINEIIGALAGQLVNKVLGPGGLLGTSQPSNGHSSYLSQIEAEANAANSNTAGSLGQTFSSQISTAIGYENQVKSYEDSSLQILGVAQNAYSSALLQCQNNSVVTNQINNDTSDGSSGTINSLIGQLQIEDDNASTTLTALNNFSQEVSTVTSTNDLNTLMQEWNQASGQLPSADNVSAAQGENTNMQAEVALATSTAATYQSECAASSGPPF